MTTFTIVQSILQTSEKGNRYNINQEKSFLSSLRRQPYFWPRFSPAVNKRRSFFGEWNLKTPKTASAEAVYFLW